MSRIIIVGAGPAGLILAKNLKNYGKQVVIFDHKIPWEKPCGGILTHSVTSEFIDIEYYPYKYKVYDGINFITLNNEHSFVAYKYPFHVVSRKDLSMYMQKQLSDSGISIIYERISKIEYNSTWKIFAGNKEYNADILVGADGAQSIVRRQLLGTIPRKHRYIACGYFLDNVNIDKCTVKFSYINGYMWILSSSRHSTAGILAQDGSINGKELLDHLYRFVNDLYPSAKIISKYSAFIPSASDPSFYDQPCAGDNWILVGDAAGHTEPLLGEGIYYAMKSGQLAAQAITAGDIIGYDKLWRDCYGNILKESSINKQNLLVLTDKFGSEAYGAFLYYNIFMNQL